MQNHKWRFAWEVESTVSRNPWQWVHCATWGWMMKPNVQPYRTRYWMNKVQQGGRTCCRTLWHNNEQCAAFCAVRGTCNQRASHHSSGCCNDYFVAQRLKNVESHQGQLWAVSTITGHHPVGWTICQDLRQWGHYCMCDPGIQQSPQKAEVSCGGRPSKAYCLGCNAGASSRLWGYVFGYPGEVEVMADSSYWEKW